MKVLFIKPLPLKYENSNKKFNEIHSVGTIFSIEKTHQNQDIIYMTWFIFFIFYY